MDSDEARQHLTMVDGILRRNERRLHLAPMSYILWGVSNACIYAGYMQQLPSEVSVLFYACGILLSFVALLSSAWSYRVAITDRYTMLDRQAFAAFAGITLFMIVMKPVWNAHALVDGAAYALIWTFGFAVSMVLIGAAGQRILLAGGCILFCGMIAGSISPNSLAISLAIASFLGIAGPGVFFALRRNDG